MRKFWYNITKKNIFHLAINTINEKSTNRASRIQRFTIFARDFSIKRGELGPTYKLRRPIAAKMHAFEIVKLYQESF